MTNKITQALPSLESFDEGTAEVLDHTDALDYSSSEADAYAREATIDGRDLETQADAIEGGLNDIASVESLLEAIESARDVGLEMGSAQFMQIHLHSLQSRYGIDDLNCAVPALESFQDRRARLATSISCESIKETVAKIWAWIKEQFQKFMQMIKDLFRKVTKSLDFVYDDADKLKQEVRRNKFDGGEKIDLGRAARKISLEGKVSADFTSALNTVGELSRVGEETLARIRKDVLDTTRLRWGDLKDSETAHSAFNKEVPVPAGFTLVKEGSPFTFSAAGALNLHSSKRLPGDRFVLVGSFGANNSEEMTPIGGTPMRARAFVQADASVADVDSTVVALSSTEVFTLCQRLQKTVASLKTAREAVEQHMEATRRAIDELANSSEAKFDNSALARKVGTFLYQRTALYGGNLFRTIDNVAFDVCVGYLAYGKRSAAAAEAKRKAENNAVPTPAPRALPASV